MLIFVSKIQSFIIIALRFYLTGGILFNYFSGLLFNYIIQINWICLLNFGILLLRGRIVLNLYSGLLMILFVWEYLSMDE